MSAASPLARKIMASSPKESREVIEGVFAINKPQWASSASVLRNLQTHFQTSPLFTPWLDSQRRHLIFSNSKKRHIQNLKVKLGHGGTLDPLATGVLIVGVGKGTKCLQRFLECTKSYECVVLFGAATDSYDTEGKVVSRAPYGHVTRRLVEEKLKQFRGKIMQKPSIFSALKVDGKKMYQYARAGGEVPEVQARPVEVHELELVEWLEPDSHDFRWPKEEVDSVEKVGAEKLMGARNGEEVVDGANEPRGVKRSRGEEDNLVSTAESHSKKARADSEPAIAGELQAEDIQTEQKPTNTAADETKPELVLSAEPKPNPPAARLRMTVTSGFYVRSLCHDLGLACNSLGLMSSLLRSRQGDYELGKNTLEYSDLEAGSEVWEPKVKSYLEGFMAKEGWEAEVVEDEESWRANRKEREQERREADRERSFQGSKKHGNEKGSWKRGKGNYYSKDMNGGRD